VRFVRCGVCRSLYHAEAPDRERIGRIYQEDYHLRRGHSAEPSIEAVKIATITSYLEMLESAGLPGSRRRLVEVGCSSGAGLTAAGRLGWIVYGVEYSEAAAEEARRRPGVASVYTGTLEEAPFEDGSMDAITFFDVIEHIDPPEPAMRAVHRLLRPGGLVLMVTPNAASLSARLMRSRWPHLFVEHVILYSPAGLQALLERHGFRAERLGYAWKRVNLEMLVRHATLHPHVLFGGVLRLAGRVLPERLRERMIRFNIGEFYVIARRRAGE